MQLLALVLGFFGLAKGAGWLVDGGVTLARRWGISPLTVGLTVVAWGTSMPEIVVASLASGQGDFGVSLGTVIGSNVANIGLVIGVTVFVLPALLGARMAAREGMWLLGTLFLLAGVAFDGDIDRLDALILLAAFGVYEWLLFRRPPAEQAHDAEEEVQAHDARHPLLEVLLGSVAIAVGAKLVMVGAEGLALRAGISTTVISLTVFAVGTSLPELAAGIGSALKGHTDIGLGNVIGSNVFNTLAVVGVAGLIGPVDQLNVQHAVPADVLAVHLPVALAFSAALIVLPAIAIGRLRRGKAALLLGGYLSYCLWLFV